MVIFSFQFKPVQTYAAKKAAAYLSKELKTRLEEYNMKTRQSYNIQDPYGVIEFGDILNTVFKMMASIVSLSVVISISSLGFGVIILYLWEIIHDVK